MPHILAIDQSTSATKALLFDADGRLLDKVSADHRQLYPQPGRVEHDAEEIWRNTLASLRAIVERNGLRASSLSHLSITNQRETFVVFERGSGRPLCNAIVWQCRRGDAVCSSLVAAGHAELVTRKTGLKVDTYFTAPKIAQLVRDQPDLARLLADGSALIGTIDAYLIHRLTGGRVFATDHTNASRTLLYDIRQLRWDDELCGLFDVPRRALPEVRDSTGRFGDSDLDGLLDARIPICGVMGDSQASLLAHGCTTPGTAKVTLGSGSSVLLNVGPALRHCRDGAAVSTIAWTHDGRATYSFEGIINYAAATIGWLKDQLKLIGNAEETEALATAVADNGGVYFVPAFAGLSAPYWSPAARAAIVGMTAHADRGHVVRAALESIGYQLRDVLDVMKRDADVPLHTIRADGGATRNGFLMQFVADMTGLEVAAARMPECSPLGAALAGAVGMGTLAFDGVATIRRDAVRYVPAMSPDRAAELHAGWKRAVRQVLAGVGP